jgi:hypothetical protein
LKQPVAAMHAAPGPAGNTNSACGGLVALKALVSAEDVYAHAHGLPLF